MTKIDNKNQPDLAERIAKEITQRLILTATHFAEACIGRGEIIDWSDADAQRIEEDIAKLIREELEKDALAGKRPEGVEKLIEACKETIPILEHLMPFLKYQRPGKEFWPNREEGEGLLGRLQTALEELGE